MSFEVHARVYKFTMNFELKAAKLGGQKKSRETIMVIWQVSPL